jgi:hypothetical protein
LGSIVIPVNKNVRNIVIVLALAALVVAIPGGGDGAQTAIQAVSLLFLGALAWFVSVLYRQHRSELYGLGDHRRAALYIACGVGVLTLTAFSKMWATAAGELAWFALMVAAVYTVFTVIWSARRY